MGKLLIENVNGSQTQIDVVRYFKETGQEYIVYSLDEKDNQGYLKLYVGKVSSIIENISDDQEWNHVKDLIKEILKQNNEGNLTVVEDLNEKRLTEVELISAKPFKLSEAMVELLGKNKKEFYEETDNSTSVINTESDVTMNVADPVGVEQFLTEEPSIEQAEPVIPVEMKPIEIAVQAPVTNYQDLYLKEKERNQVLAEELEACRNKIETLRQIIEN